VGLEVRFGNYQLQHNLETIKFTSHPPGERALVPTDKKREREREREISTSVFVSWKIIFFYI
jgi:hypothetical protein